MQTEAKSVQKNLKERARKENARIVEQQARGHCSGWRDAVENLLNYSAVCRR